MLKFMTNELQEYWFSISAWAPCIVLRVTLRSYKCPGKKTSRHFHCITNTRREIASPAPTLEPRRAQYSPALFTWTCLGRHSFPTVLFRTTNYYHFERTVSNRFEYISHQNEKSKALKFGCRLTLSQTKTQNLKIRTWLHLLASCRC